MVWACTAYDFAPSSKGLSSSSIVSRVGSVRLPNVAIALKCAEADAEAIKLTSPRKTESKRRCSGQCKNFKLQCHQLCLQTTSCWSHSQRASGLHHFVALGATIDTPGKRTNCHNMRPCTALAPVAPKLMDSSVGNAPASCHQLS